MGIMKRLKTLAAVVLLALTAAAQQIPHDGLRVWTKELLPNGKVKIGVECKTGETAPAKGFAKVEVLFGEECLYWFTQKAKAGETFSRDIRIDVPQLWSQETPVLYKVVYTLYEGKQEIGRAESMLGIRTFRMDAAQGLLLNDKPLRLRGIYMSEQSPSDENEQMDEGTLRHLTKTLLNMGCNIIRVKGGMPSPTLCKVCDESGMMLLAEPAETWQSTDSAETVKRVCEVRNHPSVVMWSAGNESSYNCPEAETENAKTICRLIKAADPTRPITAGLNQIDCAKNSGLEAMLDITGLNNSPFRYQEAYLKTRQHKVLGTKCKPTKEERDMMQANEWIAGQFVEQDIVPILSKNDTYYQYRSLWNKKQHTLRLTPHWNYAEGSKASIRALTDLPTVELLLNGKSIGKSDSAVWHDIPFEKGELKAIGYDAQGKQAATCYMKTAGDAVHIELVPEYAGDMTFIKLNIEDANNTLCPQFEGEVKVTAEGSGQLTARFDNEKMSAIDGHEAVLHVKGGQTTIVSKGNIRLTATADDLIGAILQINHNK